MSNLYRGNSIVSIHLVNWFQRRGFLEIDQPVTRIPYGGHVC